MRVPLAEDLLIGKNILLQRIQAATPNVAIGNIRLQRPAEVHESTQIHFCVSIILQK